MTLLDVSVDLLTRALLLSIPLSVGALAFRRLLISRSGNALLYAITVGYCTFSVAGLIPWAMGFQAPSATFIVFGLLCPLIWGANLSVTAVRTMNSSNEPPAITPNKPQESASLLILTNPLQPENQVIPIFRHQHIRIPAMARKSSNTLAVARSMRGRNTSEARRARKLLPAPESVPLELPFLR